MRRGDTLSPAQQAFGVAAAGLALLDATVTEARTRPIEGVRLAQSPMPASSGDTYQDGRALLAAGDIAGAIAAFRATLLANPQSVDALNGLGVAYDRIGRYDISRSYYDTALAIEPGAVLVLNNLGYSLYLQGADREAIPLLQQVVASNDAAAQRAGQRVLTLIAARMRADAIEGRAPVVVAAAAAPAETAVAPVRIETPQARIEITASGEQRLVIGAPAPDAALAATLGDAAPLVLVSKAWTPRDEAALAAREAAADRAAERAARAALAEQLATALDTARQQATGEIEPDAPSSPLPVAATTAARRRFSVEAPDPAGRPADGTPQTAMARIASSRTPVARTAMARTEMVDNALALSARLSSAISMRIAATADQIDRSLDDAARRAAAGGARRPAPIVVAADLAALAGVAADVDSDDAAPVWLLASRRAPRAAETTIAAGKASADDHHDRFESDDDDLNAFAARMRGAATAPADGPVPIEVAVARLEALLRRIRAA